MITGKDLIELGYKPGNWFKDAIVHANENNLDGELLTLYLQSVCPAVITTIEPFNNPVFYHKNIKADIDHEESNIKNVFSTMDELMKTPTIVNGAIMPDACPTGGIGQIPVGGVAVAKNAIHPAMHSADICCSVMMTNFGNIDPKLVLDVAHKITHFGPGGRRDKLFELPYQLEQRIKDNLYLGDEKSLELARTHLGTQGASNHFLF